MDINGDIMDAHDGCLEYFNGYYWLYGTRYGDTSGYGQTNTYVCYSSPDLEQWTPHGIIIPNAKPAVYFRPYVKHCPHTGKWVLWYCWAPRWRGSTLWNSGHGVYEKKVDAQPNARPDGWFRFGVAVGDKPEGPFHVINEDARLTRKTKGDLNLFVDDDGAGYIVYASMRDDYKIMVEKLTPDFLMGSGEVSEVIYSGAEAPCMFKLNNYYYVLCGELCCFCPQGSGAQVFRSSHPLGPYEPRNNINRLPSQHPVITEKRHPIIIHGQETHVAQIHTTDGPQHIWIADLWQTTPDEMKGHDLQFWSSPLKVNDRGDLLPLKYEPEWNTTLKPPG